MKTIKEEFIYSQLDDIHTALAKLGISQDAYNYLSDKILRCKEYFELPVQTQGEQEVADFIDGSTYKLPKRP